MRKEILTVRAGIVCLEIVLLIISYFAFSWLIGDIDSGIAGADSINCCLRNNQGTSCMDYSYSDCATQCSSVCLPTNCENSAGCKLGCCFDSREGICSANSEEGKCTSEGGIWKDSASCSLSIAPECKSGCCVLGRNTEFVTSKRCEKRASESGLRVDFRPGMDEISCTQLADAGEMGACKLADNSCRMMTNSECRRLTGRNIVKDVLCTSSLLNTTCRKTQETACIDGKDEVYFLDSCGNTANIYDSGKINDQNYWERVLSKEESCGASSSRGNANSASCGNCDYFAGSRCKNYQQAGASKPSYGENICRDMNCKQALDNVGKKDRRNGESWCVYDGKVGGGDDVPGSRHFKYSCIGGEVISEPCSDFRNQICVQKNELLANGNKFSTASCRINNWQECISTNTEKGKECSGIDCIARKINVDSGFKFEMCVPKYPEGFDLSGSSSAQEICNLASQKCIVTYEKKLSGWECVSNCDCEKAEFTKQMNELCRSLGDCGGESNIAGKYVQNFKSDAGKLEGSEVTRLKNLAVPVHGNYAEVGNVSQILAGKFGFQAEKSGSGSDSPNSGEIGTAVGGAGAAGVGYLLARIAENAARTAGGQTVLAVPFRTVTTPTLASFGNAVTGLGLGIAIGSIAAMISGLKGDAALIATISGGVAGLTAGIATGTFGAGASIGANTGLIAGSTITAASGATSTAITSGTVAVTNAAGVTTTLTATAQAPVVISAGQTATAITSVSVGEGAAAGSGGAVAAIGSVIVPILVITIITIIIIVVLMKLLKIGEMRQEIVEFKCYPWQAPTGGADCGKCNADKPCSKYRCESLGQACQFLNEGSSNELCVSAVDDGKAPVIIPWSDALKFGNFSYRNASTNGFQLRDKEGNCIQAFTPVVFGISTDKAAQCKFDLVSKSNFDDMQNYFGDLNFYIFNHTQGFTLPSVDFASQCVNDSNASKIIVKALSSFKLYARCQESFGNYNPTEYVIETCVNPSPDRTAPYISSSNPNNGDYLANNATEKDIVIYTNEPAQCRFSLQDKNYDAMENSLSCFAGCLAQTAFGWQCSTTLGNLTKGSNNMFIRCTDQPWLTDESKRNVNQQSYKYNLKVSESALEIYNISPNGTLRFGSDSISVNLGASTRGGAENGKAQCSYSWAGRFIPFFNTNSNRHTQRGLNLAEGDYFLPVRCVDSAGNTAESSLEFRIEVDRNYPLVTRIYNKGESLYLLTDENSDCSYSNINCGFIFENGTKMSGGFSQEHFLSFDSSKTYYVRCRDAWNNEQTDCSIKVKLYNS